MSAHSIQFPTARVDSRIADDLVRRLQMAALVAEPQKRLRATRHAYTLAMTKIRAALDALGHFKSDAVMRGCWDEEAFLHAAATAMERDGTDDAECVIELVDIPIGDESFIPIRPRGRVSVNIGRIEGHDGWDMIDREVEFTADGEVIRAGTRLFAVYSLTQAEE